jgi:hypothetical protein
MHWAGLFFSQPYFCGIFLTLSILSSPLFLRLGLEISCLRYVACGYAVIGYIFAFQDSLVFLMLGGYILVGTSFKYLFNLYFDLFRRPLCLLPMVRICGCKLEIFFITAIVIQFYSQGNVESQLSEMISRLDNQRMESERKSKKEE